MKIFKNQGFLNIRKSFRFSNSKLLFLIVFALISVNCAFAANITISMDDSFIGGQTVSAKVAMDNFAVNKLSLLDSSNTKVPVGFFYYNYGNKEYLVYFNLPASLSGNYRLYASDKFMEEGVLKEINASSAFSVSSGNAFTITPAIVKISPSASSFRINLRHTAGTALDAAVSVSDNVLKPVRDSISLAVGETKSLTVNYQALNLKQDAVLRLSSGPLLYEIPVIALKQENETAVENATVNITQTPEESFEGALVTVKNISIIRNSANENQVIAGAVEFKNINPLPLHNILFTSSGISSLEFNETNVPDLLPNAVYSQKITINREKNAEPGKYFGSITAQSSEGASLTIRLEIEFTPAEEIEIPEENASSTVIPHKPKSNITVELVNVSMPMINVSQTNKINEAEKSRNLWIAIALISLILFLAILGYYTIRPKVKYKLMAEYAKGLDKPKKK
jgi:hypothetical protein